MVRALIGGVASLAALLAPLVIASGDGGSSGAEARQAVVVTRDDPDAPSGCRPRAVGERLVDFAEALRTADTEALRQFWGSRFKWFSVTGPGRERHFVAYRRGTALRYIRRKDGLPITLSEADVDFEGYAGANMAYGGAWGARELPQDGKGFLLCNKPTIRVWSMAIARRGEPAGHGQLCPKPPAGTDPDALVVCARGRR